MLGKARIYPEPGWFKDILGVLAYKGNDTVIVDGIKVESRTKAIEKTPWLRDEFLARTRLWQKKKGQGQAKSYWEKKNTFYLYLR